MPEQRESYLYAETDEIMARINDLMAQIINLRARIDQAEVDEPPRLEDAERLKREMRNKAVEAKSLQAILINKPD